MDWCVLDGRAYVELIIKPSMCGPALEGMNAPLPNGWQENIDDEGRPYYFEVATRKTQWAHPYDPYFKDLLARARSAILSASEKI